MNKSLIKEKPHHCCVCTSTKNLVPYMGTKWRCTICINEGRYPSKKGNK
jgi:hypothetical protein